uniref:Uncharacterized protein n=2 Tax=viral metagenome TaxID=1070528 RepID=A0A6M3MDJ1_9ZZZZ
MVSKYEKLIVTTNPVDEEKTTAFIEVLGDANDIAITTLEGEYHTVEEFEAAFEKIKAYFNKTISALDKMTGANDRDEAVIKWWTFFPMTLPDARALTEALMEVIQAAEDGCLGAASAPPPRNKRA